VDFATKGGAVPTMASLRSRMGVPSGATNTANQKQGAESYDTPKETGKRKPVSFQRKVAAPWADFVGPLQNGDKAVVISLSYRIVNEKRPSLSGDPRFMGNHSVMFLGSRETSNGIEVKSWDSLYDGRRTGIPKGPQWWPLWLVRDAAAAFAGAGKVTGGIVPTSPPRVVSPPSSNPEPEPPVDIDDVISREREMEEALNEERAALIDFIVRAQERIGELDRLLPTNTQQALAVVMEGTSEEPEEAP
jgi:hypothetical protein